METTLDKLKHRTMAHVKSLTCHGALRRRIIDMGITPGAAIFVCKTAPFGDPLQVNVRGYELSLRLSEAAQITVEYDEKSEEKKINVK